MNQRLVVAATVIAFGAVGASCFSAASDPQVGITTPDESQFMLVSLFLDHRCGSLDCHGQVGRNLRIWGCEGMRFSAHDSPFCSGLQGGSPTTDDENHATFLSLVGLEPAVMSAVVADHGAHPELLTFVRKARGLEAHKGGVLITPGDDQDHCVTSWLAGQTDLAACTAALAYPMFPMIGPPTP